MKTLATLATLAMLVAAAACSGERDPVTGEE
jgi:hypothetical protein